MLERRMLALLLGATLTVTACGDDDPGAGEAPADAPAEAPEDTPEEPEATEEPVEPDDMTEAASTITTADSDFGTVLVDDAGNTLYVFDNDTDGTSTCTGDCEANWPPLVGPAEAAGDADASLLGTTEREDGTVQVTYDGLPLYYFAGDQAPGDTNGQGVGDIWWVVAPDGSKITDTEQASADSY